MELDNNYGRKKKECSREFIGLIIGNHIKLIDVINSGSFGDIYLGQTMPDGEYCAVKFNKAESKKNRDLMLQEYGLMQKLVGKGCFPSAKIEYAFQSKTKKTILIMDHLGPNIGELFKLCNKKLSYGTVAFLMVGMLERLKELHSVGIIHRDIKPENFCVGGKNLNLIYMIDFGLSKEYWDPYGAHKELDTKSGFVGTPRYASNYSHNGYSQSRRDDLEALGFMAIFLIEGSLPWQKIKITDKKMKHKELYKQKSKVDFESLCQNVPRYFLKYFEKVRALEFKTEPPYQDLIDLMQVMAVCYDQVDWYNNPEVLSSHQVRQIQRKVRREPFRGGRRPVAV